MGCHGLQVFTPPLHPAEPRAFQGRLHPNHVQDTCGSRTELSNGRSSSLVTPLLPSITRQATVVTMEYNWEAHLKGMLRYAASTTCRRAQL